MYYSCAGRLCVLGSVFVLVSACAPENSTSSPASGEFDAGTYENPPFWYESDSTSFENDPDWNFGADAEKRRGDAIDGEYSCAEIDPNIRASVFDTNPETIARALGFVTLNPCRRVGDYYRDCRFQSPSGLIYGNDPNFGNRITHVLRHAYANPCRSKHSVFAGDQLQPFRVIEAGWITYRNNKSNTDAVCQQFSHNIGTNGETILLLVVDNNNAANPSVVTSYPQHTMPDSCRY